MPNLSDSCRINRLPASIRQIAEDAKMPFPLSLRSFIRAACPHAHCVHLHLKVVESPPSFTEPAARDRRFPELNMLVAMRTVYDTAGIGVTVGSREFLPAGDRLLNILDVGLGRMPPQAACQGDTTADQNALFANRKGAADDDVVVYWVEGTQPALNGCASHPVGQPGAVIADVASLWTLAHEVGHVLGLGHIAGEKNAGGVCVTPDPTRLMTGCSTSAITGTPTVSGDEIALMQSSPSIHRCPR